MQVKGLCWTLHTIHWRPVACSWPKRTTRVEESAFMLLLISDNDPDPPPPQPNDFPCQVPPLRALLRMLCQGLRLSNRDCACLRLSQGFEVGSYPSWAIQPSIPAWYRWSSGHGCYEGRGYHWLQISLFHPNMWQVNCGPLFFSLISFRVRLKINFVGSMIIKAGNNRCNQVLTICLFSALLLFSISLTFMWFNSSLWNDSDISRGVLDAASLRTIT